MEDYLERIAIQNQLVKIRKQIFDMFVAVGSIDKLPNRVEFFLEIEECFLNGTLVKEFCDQHAGGFRCYELSRKKEGFEPNYGYAIVWQKSLLPCRDMARAVIYCRENIK